MNSFTRSICRWYLAVPEYNLWMMADTFPKMLAYIRARREATEGNGEAHDGYCGCRRSSKSYSQLA